MGDLLRPRAAGVVVMLILSACVGLDRAERTQFREVAPGQFLYRATTDYFYTPDPSGWAEQERLRWLETYLATYGMCPRGYQLASRRTFFLYESKTGYPVTDIEYEGRCNP